MFHEKFFLVRGPFTLTVIYYNFFHESQNITTSTTSSLNIQSFTTNDEEHQLQNNKKKKKKKKKETYQIVKIVHVARVPALSPTLHSPVHVGRCLHSLWFLCI